MADTGGLNVALQAELLAIRAQALALVLQIDAVVEGHGCRHANRVTLTTAGAPMQRFLCKDCQVEFEEPWPEESE